jgi:8-oxo-dGTP pyrophosphatase MutT (NUDIX family)
MPPASGGRRSAVLVLFADGPNGPDLLFIQRSKGLRLHAGETAFPGGVIDAADEGPVAAALREAAEEAGVDPGDVDVVATLPSCSSRRPDSGLLRCLPGGDGPARWPRLILAKWLRSSGSASASWPIPPPG